MENKAPLISVLMPVYNAAPYVEDAIRSILNQTFIDYELLIFNDGSTDESSKIIRAISDQRIKLFDYTANSGYVAHLNEGLRIARGKYIARMDADDIALPERFAKQVQLLDNEPSIGLCGTAYQIFGSAERVIQLPSDNQRLRAFMLEHCPIGHPTVMFRRQVVEQYKLAYNKNYMPAEDYKMWYDFSQVSELHNLPEVLLRYRMHPHQISNYQSEKQLANADLVRIKQLTDKGFKLTAEEQQLYCQFLNPQTDYQNASEFDAVLNLTKKIIYANRVLQAYDEDVFPKLFSSCWHRLISKIKHFNPSYIIPVLLKNSPYQFRLTLPGKIRFTLKTLLFWEARVRS